MRGTLGGWAGRWEGQPAAARCLTATDCPSAGPSQALGKADLACLSCRSGPLAPFLPSRMRQLEEELRTMDQALKSLMAAEEEVLSWGAHAFSPPLSLSLSELCAPHSACLPQSAAALSFHSALPCLVGGGEGVPLPRGSVLSLAQALCRLSAPQHRALHWACLSVGAGGGAVAVRPRERSLRAEGSAGIGRTLCWGLRGGQAKRACFGMAGGALPAAAATPGPRWGAQQGNGSGARLMSDGGLGLPWEAYEPGGMGGLVWDSQRAFPGCLDGPCTYRAALGSL